MQPIIDGNAQAFPRTRHTNLQNVAFGLEIKGRLHKAHGLNDSRNRGADDRCSLPGWRGQPQL